MAERVAVEEWANAILQKTKTCEVCEKIPAGLLFMIPEDLGGDGKWHKICEKCVEKLQPSIHN